MHTRSSSAAASSGHLVFVRYIQRLHEREPSCIILFVTHTAQAYCLSYCSLCFSPFVLCVVNLTPRLDPHHFPFEPNYAISCSRSFEPKTAFFSQISVRKYISKGNHESQVHRKQPSTPHVLRNRRKAALAISHPITSCI